MRAFRSWAPLVVSTLLLAACGGSDPDVPGSGSPAGAPTTKGTFTAIVSFGDSLSDVGTYTPATSVTGNGAPPYIGGKFTTNSATGTIWVENLATTLGLLVTPAEVGFAGTSAKCPVATTVPSLAGTCTGYGQGGSRVTDPNGIGHANGALTVPVVTQIANHLTRFTSFKSSDLIFVYAGSNDVFTQFTTFATAAGTIQANAAAGTITADQANQQLFAAQTAAQAGMKQAAQELVALINTQILAKGGTYVAVMTLSDIGDTPFGASLPATAKPVLTSLSQVFNLWLRDGLTGRPVQIIDTFALFKTAAANSAALGFVDATTPACDVAKIFALTGGTSTPPNPNAITDGSSLFCNSTPGSPLNGLTTGASATTWFFADSVHPTTGGHKVISDAFAAQLRAFGWI
ncbi:MAG: SGNH/GDSL hydrolase family protein [Caldimonas sp.]